MTQTPQAESLPGLLPHHLAELRRSGLTDATITASGIHSETQYTRLAALLNWPKVSRKMAPAIVFPFKKIDGSNGYHRIKPDLPRLRKQKPIKYESPKGAANEIYIPSGTIPALTNAEAELLITEGEKKSLSADQHGFYCLGLVGVFGWKPGKSEHLLPALEAIPWKGRPVKIVFDSDITTNKDVQEAESRLAKHLTDRGAIVRVARLPDGPADADGKPTKMGLDDFIVARGPGELRKLLDSAEEPTPLSGIESKELAASLDPATEAAAYIETGKVDGLSRLRFWRGEFMLWTRGQYAEVRTSEVRGYLIEHLNKNFHHLTGRTVSDLLDQLRSQTMLRSSIEAPAWNGQAPVEWKPDEILVTRSGMVHLPSVIDGKPDYLRPLTPRLFSTCALDYDFRADVGKPTAWLDFLNRLWPDDPQSISVLQQWFGYSLSCDTSQQKILMLIGPRRSGKGTIARILGAIVGKGNVAGPTLGSLATNFGLWPLVGKSVAIISDARLSNRSDQAVIVERLLSISGEDALTVDRKNMEPITAKLSSRFVLLSNELPRLADASGALAGRMILLQLTESWFGREDHTLTKNLLAELPAILLWSIEGWRRLREHGRFIQPDSSAEMLAELDSLTSPVGEFVRECCEINPAANIPREDLYKAYQEWSKSQGREHVEDDAVFGRNLRAVFPKLKGSNRRCGAHRARYHEGISLKSGT